VEGWMTSDQRWSSILRNWSGGWPLRFAAAGLGVVSLISFQLTFLTRSRSNDFSRFDGLND
ncbi:MAG: hypothetical protein ACE5F6_22045, partial [Anaerolineae bacterium]